EALAAIDQVSRRRAAGAGDDVARALALLDRVPTDEAERDRVHVAAAARAREVVDPVHDAARVHGRVAVRIAKLDDVVARKDPDRPADEVAVRTRPAFEPYPRDRDRERLQVDV